jgi:hypothetical protein
MTPSKFIGMLFHSRDMMHIAHLQTTSFAEHKALNGYYDNILDLTDNFIEAYFGQNKRVEIVIPEAKNMDAMSHMKEMMVMLNAERGNYSSELQNIIDEMLALVDKTAYLLTLT